MCARLRDWRRIAARCNPAGHLTKGSVATGCAGLGRAGRTVDNSAGAAGAPSLIYRPGTFLLANATVGDLIAIADIGKPCFIVDRRTVARTDATATRSRAPDPAEYVPAAAVAGILAD